MGQEELVVHGAREHNLKDITVRLPRHKLICVTGLSGSGKSSLACDTINAPVVRDRKGEYKDVFEELRAEGFTRVKVDGEQYLLEEPPTLDKKFKHTIEVVVDRLVMKPDLRQRLAQSVETAAQLAEGLVVVDVING